MAKIELNLKKVYLFELELNIFGVKGLENCEKKSIKSESEQFSYKEKSSKL